METKTTMPLAMLRRALSAQLLELEQMHELAKKATFRCYPDTPVNDDELTMTAHMSLAIDHMRHANAIVGKLLFSALSDADREQAAEAGRRA
jgi:hypothetical protein